MNGWRHGREPTSAPWPTGLAGLTPIFALCLAILVAIGARSGAVAQPDPRAAAALQRMDAWRASVVLVWITCPDGRGFQGSGVVVSDLGHVLTAAHVGSGCLDATVARMGRVRSPYVMPAPDLSAVLIARRGDGVDAPDQGMLDRLTFEDVALWQIADFAGSGLAPARLSARFQIPGEEVVVVGFAGLPFSYPRNPHGGLPALTIHRGSLYSIAATAGEVPYRLHYDSDMLPGTSGGPVFDGAGDLIGIHSTRVTANLTHLVSTACVIPTPPAWNDDNCKEIVSPDGRTVLGTVGVNHVGLKALLSSYSFATSIHALPPGWLAPP